MAELRSARLKKAYSESMKEKTKGSNLIDELLQEQESADSTKEEPQTTKEEPAKTVLKETVPVQKIQEESVNKQGAEEEEKYTSRTYSVPSNIARYLRRRSKIERRTQMNLLNAILDDVFEQEKNRKESIGEAEYLQFERLSKCLSGKNDAKINCHPTERNAELLDEYAAKYATGKNIFIIYSVSRAYLIQKTGQVPSFDMILQTFYEQDSPWF